MTSLKEILDYKEYVEKVLYTKVREEQQKDQSYIDDTFEVPEVKAPHYIYRSGYGVDIVDSPADQIVADNPQVFVDILKGTKDAAGRLSKTFNDEWVGIIKRQNPNPFKEFIKNQLGRGEAFIRVAHNPLWVKDGGERKGLPVIFQIPDPMVIYASPEEDDNGIPDKVVVIYERQLMDVVVRYPKWTNPKGKGTSRNSEKMVTWWEYWDKGTRYIEADGEPVSGGLQPNIYGITPFVRKYSPFGKRSPAGDLSKLIVSDIKRSRDLLREECAMRSNIASVEYLFAHKATIITAPPEGLDEEKTVSEFSIGAYDATIVPYGSKIDFMEIAPNAESHRHLADIRAELNQRYPLVLAGFPFGTSGRQQGMTESSGMRRYDPVVKNTQMAWATALEIALQICGKVPGLKPDYITKADLKVTPFIEVRLKAEDPLEADRMATLGNRLWNGGQGAISLRMLHTQYLGMTVEESDEEIGRMGADQMSLYNPEIAQMLGSVAAQEGGLERVLEQMRQMTPEGGGVRPQPTASSQQRTQGEVQSPEGMEESLTRGARQPPRGYNRG